MATFVMCRACRQRFDREKLLKEVDWVMPSRNFYYQKNVMKIGRVIMAISKPLWQMNSGSVTFGIILKEI